MQSPLLQICAASSIGGSFESSWKSIKFWKCATAAQNQLAQNSWRQQNASTCVRRYYWNICSESLSYNNLKFLTKKALFVYGEDPDSSKGLCKPLRDMIGVSKDQVSQPHDITSPRLFEESASGHCLEHPAIVWNDKRDKGSSMVWFESLWSDLVTIGPCTPPIQKSKVIHRKPIHKSKVIGRQHGDKEQGVSNFWNSSISLSGCKVTMSRGFPVERSCDIRNQVKTQSCAFWPNALAYQTCLT